MNAEEHLKKGAISSGEHEELTKALREEIAALSTCLAKVRKHLELITIGHASRFTLAKLQAEWAQQAIEMIDKPL